MDSNELKKQLLEYGATEEELAKIDFAAIENLLENASDIDEFCISFKKIYPNFNEAEFKQLIADNSDNSENAQELSDEDLESVAGGSIGSWFSKNKQLVICSAIIGAALIASPFVYKAMQKKAATKASEEYMRGDADGYNLAVNNVQVHGAPAKSVNIDNYLKD